MATLSASPYKSYDTIRREIETYGNTSGRDLGNIPTALIDNVKISDINPTADDKVLKKATTELMGKITVLQNEYTESCDKGEDVLKCQKKLNGCHNVLSQLRAVLSSKLGTFGGSRRKTMKGRRKNKSRRNRKSRR